MMKETFSSYHPIVNFTYFTVVMVLSMILMHPLALGISFFCSFFYAYQLKERRKFLKGLLLMLPVLIFAALMNPAFNHEGATILAYFPNGNPLTLESIVYGIAAAILFIAVINWFSCYTHVMTSDKFIYLFGKVIPALSLVLSMVLRFVPQFQAQLKTVANAQRLIGRDVSSGSLLQRIKHGLKILSIMVTWMLENAIETADSMKSRGYGLKGRTAYSIFRFDSRDKIAMAALLSTAIYVLFGCYQKAFYYRYYPTMKSSTMNLYVASVFAAYFLLCITPVLINGWEGRKWRYLRPIV